MESIEEAILDQMITAWWGWRVILWQASIVFSLALYAGDADAQRNGRERGNDVAVKAAVVVDGHIEMLIRRLGACVDLDTRNSATYLMIVPEYLRDKNVSGTLVKTEKLFEAEVRLIGGDIAKAKAARKQALDTLDQQLRQQAIAAPGQFQQDCRMLAQNFLLRQGPFRPLTTIYPNQMQSIELWTIFNDFNEQTRGLR